MSRCWATGSGRVVGGTRDELKGAVREISCAPFHGYLGSRAPVTTYRTASWVGGRSKREERKFLSWMGRQEGG